MSERAIRARGLARTFRDGEVEVHALRGVDLDVGAGEFVAITGPSGSGKSTLLHLLGALDGPTGGSLAIGGAELADRSERELTELRRDRIGFVFQFFNLLPTLTAAENALLPMLIAGEDAAGAQDRLHELFELVGLTGRESHLPAQLSGGEKQRVAIARALLRRPTLILADEPTGNLDSENGNVVLKLLRRLADEGQTVVLVTHDEDAAARADRVIRLRDGRVDPGSPEAAAA